MNTNFWKCCNQHYQFFQQHCEEMTRSCKGQVNFSVLQCDSMFQEETNLFHMLEDISNFYDENWQGNADYIHIPTKEQVYENYLHYPILIAYQIKNGMIDILGVTTIKNHINTKGNINPYYPIEKENFFEVTGIMAKKHNQIKGIGKKLYRIAFDSTIDYQKFIPNLKLLFVADCRNYLSVSAARNAKLVGYYTVKHYDGSLIEAPTFVCSFDLNKIISDTHSITFDYHICEHQYDSLLKTLEFNLRNLGIKKPIRNIDPDAGLIEFFELEEKVVSIENITILPNGTDLGNNRTPSSKVFIKKAVSR